MFDFKKIAKKTGGAIMSGANKVNKLTGGTDVSRYFGEKIAKMTAKGDAKKYVSQTVSGKDALKSAGKVGLSIATVAGAGAAAKGLSLAGKGTSAKATAKRILAKHKAGGDAKILKAIKNSPANPGKKLPVKRDSLATGSKSANDRWTSIRLSNGKPTKNLRMQTKRDVLKEKLSANRWANEKPKYLSKNEKGNMKNHQRELDKYPTNE